jgi:hypothetical protein
MTSEIQSDQGRKWSISLLHNNPFRYRFGTIDHSSARRLGDQVDSASGPAAVLFPPVTQKRGLTRGGHCLMIADGLRINRFEGSKKERKDKWLFTKQDDRSRRYREEQR